MQLPDYCLGLSSFQSVVFPVCFSMCAHILKCTYAFVLTRKVIQGQWNKNFITKTHKCMPSIPLRLDTADSGCLGCLGWDSRLMGSLYSLMLEKIEGRKRRGRQRMRWLDGITDSMDIVWVNSGSWWWEAWRATVHGVTKSRTWLSS